MSPLGEEVDVSSIPVLGRPSDIPSTMLGRTHSVMKMMSQDLVVPETARVQTIDPDADTMVVGSQALCDGQPLSTVIEEMCDCTYCIRPFPKRMMVPMGTRELAKRFRCKPCTAAQKYIDRAAESQGQAAQQSLSARRQNRPLLYAKDVVRLRICEPDEPAPSNPEFANLSISSGANAHAERKEQASNLEEFFSSYVDQKTVDGIAWMTERQFKAHYKVFEGYSQKEVDIKFQETKDNRNIKQRKDKKGNPTYPVELPETWQQARGSLKGTQMKRSAPLDDEEAEAAAFEQVKASRLGDYGHADGFDADWMPVFSGLGASGSDAPTARKQVARGSWTSLEKLLGIEDVRDGASVAGTVVSGSTIEPVGGVKTSGLQGISDAARRLKEAYNDMNISEVPTMCIITV